MYRLNEPFITRDSYIAVEDVLDSGWLSVNGTYTKRLERDLAKITGCVDAVACQSGTAALYLALRALEIEPHDLIAVPNFTCAAPADAVIQCLAEVCLVDCELETYGIEFESLKKLVQDLENDGKKLKCCILVSAYGVPCRDFFEILHFCRKNSILLLEDLCESYGAENFDFETKELKKLGSLSDCCVVSLRSEKMIGVGEGGGVMSTSQEIVNRARWYSARCQSRASDSDPWRIYEHDEVGRNYRLPEILSAVGHAGFRMIDFVKQKKREVRKMYEREIVKYEEMELQKFQLKDNPVFWLNSVKLNTSAREVGIEMKKKHPDIEIRPAFYPLNRMKPFASTRSFPNTDEIYSHCLCLPSSIHLQQEDVRFILKSIHKVVCPKDENLRV